MYVLIYRLQTKIIVQKLYWSTRQNNVKCDGTGEMFVTTQIAPREVQQWYQVSSFIGCNG